MARKFIYSAAALLAALAAVDAFQVPRMSLEKYKSELAETAKKIASPGACAGWLDGDGGHRPRPRAGSVVSFGMRSRPHPTRAAKAL